MKNLIREIKNHFGTATSLFNIMAINVVVFLFFTLLRSILFLFNIDGSWLDLIVRKLSLPSDLSVLMYQPWSIITYMFLHDGIMHILFNMLILFWTGKLLTEYLGNDKLWSTFILGGIFGGLLYILAYNLFPVFSSVGSIATLLGASAGVIAVLVAIATLLPNFSIQLLFFGEVKLKYVAIVSILLYAISIPNGNAGGQIAHLGGALFGFIMIRQLRSGRDLTKWLINLGRKKGIKKSNMKVVSRSAKSSDELFTNTKLTTQENIDRILDKINRSGFDSLTNDEKELLYRVSGKK